MARRGPALRPPTRPGSHRSRSQTRSRVTPTTAGSRRASTCVPDTRTCARGSRSAPGPANPGGFPNPRVSPPPAGDRPPAPTELRARPLARPRSPPTALCRPLAPRVPAEAAACRRDPGPSPAFPRLPGGRASSAEPRWRRQLITIDLLAPPPP
ncbi:basic proline-rich protein-like [Marmota marmota marmota]|uniref:basic proline-rich protein-like n=1 Tax=Marmota marmota marmota TaxID=9994 RepID=UPI0020936FE8|nr:basic proline-rich protein-like [Marmota marmota marmota]